jgi:hypothetical protein
MNAILEQIIEDRKGQYCHAVEVNDIYELESIADSIIQEYQDSHSEQVIIEFLSSLEVYSLSDDNETEIHNFSFTDYIKDTI